MTATLVAAIVLAAPVLGPAADPTRASRDATPVTEQPVTDPPSARGSTGVTSPDGDPPPGGDAGHARDPDTDAPSPRLVVGVTQPVDGTRLATTAGQVARVAVAATLLGAESGDATVVWRDARDGGLLLTGAGGVVEVPTEPGCQPTTLELAVAATTPDGRTADDEVTVVLAPRCATSGVRIVSPADGAVVISQGRTAGVPTAWVEVVGVGTGAAPAHVWTTDRVHGALHTSAAGVVALATSACAATRHLLTLTTTDPTDPGLPRTASTTVTVVDLC